MNVDIKKWIKLNINFIMLFLFIAWTSWAILFFHMITPDYEVFYYFIKHKSVSVSKFKSILYFSKFIIPLLFIAICIILWIWEYARRKRSHIWIWLLFYIISTVLFASIRFHQNNTFIKRKIKGYVYSESEPYGYWGPSQISFNVKNSKNIDMALLNLNKIGFIATGTKDGKVKCEIVFANHNYFLNGKISYDVSSKIEEDFILLSKQLTVVDIDCIHDLAVSLHENQNLINVSDFYNLNVKAYIRFIYKVFGQNNKNPKGNQ